MEAFEAAIVAIAIVLALLFLVVFMVFCLVRISTADAVPFLPKWVWAVAVVCVNPLGGVVYLLAQQLRGPRHA